MTHPYRVCIYQGTRLIARCEGLPRTAWPAAVTYVKAMARADGFLGGPGLEIIRGRHGSRRVSFTCGIFQALEERCW